MSTGVSRVQDQEPKKNSKISGAAYISVNLIDLVDMINQVYLATWLIWINLMDLVDLMQIALLCHVYLSKDTNQLS